MSATVAQAAFIEGTIGLGGLYTADDPDLTAATTITFGSTFAFGGTEDLDLGATPVSVTMASSLTFDPLFSVTPNGALWSVGGFNFELGSLAVTNQATDSLALNGTGTLSKTGFEDTNGTWVASFNTSGTSFIWSSSTNSGGVGVPEPGFFFPALLVLVGFALRRARC